MYHKLHVYIITGSYLLFRSFHFNPEFPIDTAYLVKLARDINKKTMGETKYNGILIKYNIFD
jgi:hypothetical protein